MDEFYMRYYKFHGISLQKMPTQIVRDHCMFSFISDRMAMKYRYDIGLDNLMWGSDFPHSVGTFPDTKEILRELFEDVPEDEKRQVLVENPCDFFGLDPERELTPTP
jgi:predicted TIM-barrel fold metal-dependent hydrolase